VKLGHRSILSYN